MSDAAFWGFLLLTAAPPAVIFCTIIAKQSFLILLSLASSFFWLVVYLIVSVIVRGFLPVTSSAGFILVVLLSVCIQEAARYGLWQVHRKTVLALELIAQKKGDTALTLDNKHALALTHGFAHGIVQAILFTISWLPESLDGATYYTPACSSMSYFLASALLSLGFFLLHTASMVLSFEGLACSDWTKVCGVAALHLAAALLTVANLARPACDVVIPVVLATGTASAVWAAKVWWNASTSGYANLSEAQSRAEP